MKRNILLSYIFSITFHFYTDLALWTIYITNYKGFSIIYIGIFQIILMATRMFLEIPSGILADKIGRVKLLTISTIILMLSNYFMIVGHSFFVISLVYICFGITTAFVSGTYDAFLYDSLLAKNQEGNYKRINTTQYVLIMVSFTVAMLIGIYLSKTDMRLMYVANIIAETTALISCLFMVEPPRTKSHSNTIKKIINDSTYIIKTNKFLIYLIAFIALTDALSNNTWHLSQKMLSTYGFSFGQVTYEAIFTTVACGIAAYLGYYAEKKYGLFGNAVITAFALALPLILLGSTKNLYIILVSLTPVSMTISFARPIFNAYINKEINSSFRATVLSIQNLLVSILAVLYVFILGLSNDIAKVFVFVGFFSIPAYIIILRKIRLYKSI